MLLFFTALGFSLLLRLEKAQGFGSLGPEDPAVLPGSGLGQRVGGVAHHAVAHALGLGSCWINRAREAFDTEEGKEILRSLGVEGEYEGVGHCIVGYPDGDLPQPKERKAGRVFWAE